MANTFRDKQTEEGLDERLRTTTARQSQRHRDAAASTGASSSGNRFRKPTEAPHEETSSNDTSATTGSATSQTAADKSSSQEQPNTTSAHHSDNKTRSNNNNGINLLSDILGGEILRSKWLRKQRGIIAILVIFCFVLVTNRYYVENLVKEQHATKERIKYLREERIQMKKDYQENVKISHIVSKLDSINVGLIAGPPYEIVVGKQKNRRNRE